MPKRISAEYSLFLQQSGNIDSTITGTIKMLFFRFTTGWTSSALYTAAGGFFNEKCLCNTISLAMCYYIKNLTLVKALPHYEY